MYIFANSNLAREVVPLPPPPSDDIQSNPGAYHMNRRSVRDSITPKGYTVRARLTSSYFFIPGLSLYPAYTVHGFFLTKNMNDTFPVEGVLRDG